MSATETLSRLRDELSDEELSEKGGYSQFVIDALIPGDPELRSYLEMISKDNYTTTKVRKLATQGLQEVETDADFLAACGISVEDLGDPT